MCVQCFANGAPYVAAAVAGLQVVKVRARSRRRRDGSALELVEQGVHDRDATAGELPGVADRLVVDQA
jgi:hypothetical protein